MQNTNIAAGVRQLMGEPSATLSSREFAALFGRAHARVLGQIEAIVAHHPEVGGDWFRRSFYLDARGRKRSADDLTCDGFMLLAMEQKGRKAASFVTALNAAWDLMKATRETSTPHERRAVADEVERTLLAPMVRPQRVQRVSRSTPAPFFRMPIECTRNDGEPVA